MFTNEEEQTSQRSRPLLHVSGLKRQINGHILGLEESNSQKRRKQRENPVEDEFLLEVSDVSWHGSTLISTRHIHLQSTITF